MHATYLGFYSQHLDLLLEAHHYNQVTISIIFFLSSSGCIILFKHKSQEDKRVMKVEERFKELRGTVSILKVLTGMVSHIPANWHACDF